MSSARQDSTPPLGGAGSRRRSGGGGGDALGGREGSFEGSSSHDVNLGDYIKMAYKKKPQKKGASLLTEPAAPKSRACENPPARRKLFSDLVKEAAAMAKAAAAALLSDADLNILFMDFLNNHGKKVRKDGKTISHYEVKLMVMEMSECSTLEVNFMDIMKDKKYIQLARRIANDADSWHGWLQPVARQFIMKRFEGQDEKQFDVSFIGKPKSLKPLKDLVVLKKLVKKVHIFGQKYVIPAATPFGRRLYLSVLLHLLENHKKGISWNGEYELDDIYILTYSETEMYCWITRKNNQEHEEEDKSFPKRWCTTLEKVNDLKKLDNILTSRYKDGDDVPLYFQQLSDDLHTLEASFLDQNQWFLTYLQFHVALMSSMARRFLVHQLCLVMSTYSLGHDKFDDEDKKIYGPIFLTKIFRDDWREAMKSLEDTVLNGVYWYENDPDLGDKYKDTSGGVLTYKRNLLEHGHNYLDKTNMMVDIDEMELFAAWRLDDVLPLLLQKLLANKIMTVLVDYLILYSKHLVSKLLDPLSHGGSSASASCAEGQPMAPSSQLVRLAMDANSNGYEYTFLVVRNVRDLVDLDR